MHFLSAMLSESMCVCVCDISFAFALWVFYLLIWPVLLNLIRFSLFRFDLARNYFGFCLIYLLHLKQPWAIFTPTTKWKWIEKSETCSRMVVLSAILPVFVIGFWSKLNQCTLHIYVHLQTREYGRFVYYGNNWIRFQASTVIRTLILIVNKQILNFNQFFPLSTTWSISQIIFNARDI